MYKYKAVSKGKTTKLTWVAESKGIITAVGVKQHASDNFYDRVILFIDAQTGTLRKEMIIPETGTSGGYECVAFDAAGNLIASGFTGSGLESLTFKSSGIVDDGVGIVDKFSSSVLSSFNVSARMWAYTNAPQNKLYAGTIKAFRIDSSQNIVGLVGPDTTLFKLNGADGKELWNTGTTLADDG